MAVSLALHAVLLVVALSFVAVTVVTKGEKKFESRQVNRPRMPPKKLQVPVKIKKQKRKPKLRQRIVVKTKVRNMPDIKMPEISGIKGGLGAGVGGRFGYDGSAKAVPPGEHEEAVVLAANPRPRERRSKHVSAEPLQVSAALGGDV